MTITVVVPKDDLVALAEAGDMLLRIARQKAITPTNAEYVADARQAEKERIAAGMHGRVFDADDIRGMVADRTPPQGVHVMPEIREVYEQAIADAQVYAYKSACDVSTGDPCECDTIAYSTQPVVGHSGQCGVPEVNAAAAFGQKLADPAYTEPLNATIVPVDPGFAERTAHMSGVMVPPAPPALQPGDTPEPVHPLRQPVPPAPPLAVTFPPQSVELDSRGLPWDRRIHSSTRNKCKTGEWKNTKGIDKDVLASVEAELRTAMAGVPVIHPGDMIVLPNGQSGIVGEPIPPAQYVLAEEVVLDNGTIGLAAVEPQPVVPAPPVSPVVPAPPAPPTATPAGCPASFPEFLRIVTGKCTARVLSYDEVTKACQAHGLSGIPLLNARPDLIPVIYAELEALWLTRS